MTKETNVVRVLVIDDEPGIVDFVQLGLTYEGFQVQTAADGQTGLALAISDRPDMIILDIMLPRMGGMEVCRRVRAEGLTAAIIMLTAKDEVADRVAGLNIGADDYLVKPFKFEELLARLRAVLRRQSVLGAADNTALTFENVTLNVPTREVTRNGRTIELTVREFDLLAYFLRHPRQVLSREVILNGVWGYDFMGDGNIIEVYVRALRQKLGEPSPIQTVRGVGYVLRPPSA